MAGTDKWLICWIWINGEVPSGSEAWFCLLQLFPNLTPIPLRSLWDIVIYLFLTNIFSVGWRFAADSWAETQADWRSKQSFSFEWSLAGRRERRTLVCEQGRRPSSLEWVSENKRSQPLILQFLQRHLHEQVWALLFYHFLSPQTEIFHYCAITSWFNSISEVWNPSALRLCGTGPTTG